MRLNKREIIDFIILFLITSIFYYLLVADKVSMFLNPRMNKYIIFAFIIFIALTINQFFNSFTINTFRAVRRGYVVFFVLLLIFIYPIQMNDVKKREVNEKINKELVYEEKKFEEIYRLTGKKLKSNIDSDENTIILDTDNYTSLFQQIMQNPESYKGEKIKTEGFIYKQKNFASDEFVIAREIMTCCVADLQIVGPMCRYSKAVDLKENEWVSVEGIIDVKENMFIINVEKITRVIKPESKYIYTN